MSSWKTKHHLSLPGWVACLVPRYTLRPCPKSEALLLTQPTPLHPRARRFPPFCIRNCQVLFQGCSATPWFPIASPTRSCLSRVSWRPLWTSLILSWAWAEESHPLSWVKEHVGQALWISSSLLSRVSFRITAVSHVRVFVQNQDRSSSVV